MDDERILVEFGAPMFSLSYEISQRVPHPLSMTLWTSKILFKAFYVSHDNSYLDHFRSSS